ncbi:MAG: hypothetical protein ABI836_03460 [Gemmatimonadota bacterium]
MSRIRLCLVALLAVGVPLGAQQVPTPDQQIAAALLPLPEPLRAGAGVRGFTSNRERVTLRPSTNGIVCSGDWPGDDQFDVRCYNAEFLAVIDFTRGLYQEGLGDSLVEERVKAAVDSRAIHLPGYPTAGYRMLGPIVAYDGSTNTAGAAIEKWQSVHFPFLTAAEIGLPTEPEGTMPYVMASGSWWAHVMIEHLPEHENR